MELPHLLIAYQHSHQNALQHLLRSSQFKEVSPWGKEAAAKLSEFATSGKGIRGSLALLGFEAYANAAALGPALSLACALELFHAAFLIHDDIMDNDGVRRGKPSIHAQLGESVAICMGDLAIFLAYETLAKAKISSQLFSFLSNEFAAVTVAQMEDVTPKDKLNEDHLLRTYRFKTARYTFSLPLTAGAMLAGAPEAAVDELITLGEHMGLLFQIRDDELDAGENKQTLLTISKHITAIKEEHHAGATRIIDSLPVSAEHRQTLSDLLTFVTTREK